MYPPSKAREFLRFYRDFMAAAPDELVIETSFDPRGILVMACYSGAPSSGARVLAPFTSFLGAPLTGGFEQMPYLGGAAPPLGHGANQPMHAPPSPAATRQGLQIYWKGGCVAELSDDALDTLLDQMRVAPPGWSVGLGHYMHGAVCRVSAGETPLIRRAGSCSYFINQGWTDPGAADARARMSWVDSAWRVKQRFSGGAAYVNYLSDDREAAVRSAYGANYPRLAALKNRYDPDNIFRLNRNIRPSNQ